MEITLVLKGRPYTKKNSNQITRHGASVGIASSKAFHKYEKDCGWQITGDKKKKLKGKIQVVAHYYMPSKASWPDLIGLMQATADILEKYEVLENDKYIASWDGTKIAGIDKCNPRAEIKIILMEAASVQDSMF